jgi:nitrite reductase/ring-hydroxylating ferredoxin subunit
MDSVPASRRSVIVAAGVVPLLGACQVYEEPAPPVPGPSSGSSRAPIGLDEIPVGGAKIFAAAGLVLVQPERGRVRAFSNVCTHQGCAVEEIAGGTINCRCHGSKFSAADGSVVAGPARRPLAEVPVTVENNTVVLG